MQTETTVTVDTTKAAWATPAIESYDVAEFTLGSIQGGQDLGGSQS